MSFPPPTVSSVVCYQPATRPSFDVAWDTTDYPSTLQYVIGIFDMSLSTPITVSDPILGSTGNVAASVDMLAANQYQIRVATYENGAPGAWSADGPVALFIPPTNLVIAYDGTTISASWQNPAAGTQPLGGRITLAFGSYQYPFDLSATSGSFVPTGVPLDPNVSTTLTVSGLYGDSMGPPSAAVTFIQNGPALALVDNPGANPRAAGVTGFVSGTPRTFNVLLSSGSTPVQWMNGLQEDANGRLSLALASEPVAGVTYALAVQLVAAHSTGPLGPAAPLVVAAPTALLVTYQSQDLKGLLGFQALLPSGAPFVSGMQITVTQADQSTPVIQQTVTAGTGVLEIAALGTTVDYSASFRSAIGIPGGLSLGPAATAAPAVLTVPPTITSLTYDGTGILAEYSTSSKTVVTAYQLEVASGGSAIATAQFSGAKGWIALPVNGGVPYSAQVRMVGAATLGTAGPSVAAIVAPGVIDKAITDPIAGTTTVSWKAVTGASSYSLQLYLNGLPARTAVTDIAETSYLLPKELAPATDAAVAIAAVSLNNGTTTTGPFGKPYRLPTAQPSEVGLDYDGATLRVGWTPHAHATSYSASVFADTATTPLVSATALAGATGVTFPSFSPDPQATYHVVVQAMVGEDSGPPTARTPLFTPGLFVGRKASEVPNVALATSLAFEPTAIALWLPDIGAGTAVQNLPLTQGPFTLAANADTASNTIYPYTLAIAAKTEVWSFTDPIRETLKNDYTTFLTTAETNHVAPWGISVLQQAISRAMPQTFQETLYYAYGMDLTKSCADLRPGMVLRVVMNDYVDVGRNAPSSWLNGYIGGSVVDYDVSSYLSPSLAPGQAWTVGFDALLSLLAASGAIRVQPPSQSPPNETAAGVADATDLMFDGFRRPFYRLFFPQDVTSPSGTGTAFTPSNFALVAAGSFADLSATVNYPTSSNAVACFRGRAIVKPCIRVIVNGIEDVVPVGTTVGNILERHARQIPSTAVTFDGVRLDRPQGLAVPVTSTVGRLNAGAAYRVRLDWSPLMVYGPARDALSLPLLHGDRLTLG